MDLLHVVLLTSLTTSVAAVQTTVCELRLGFVNCPVGQVLQIDSVLYGRTQNNVCNAAHANLVTVNCRGTQTSTSSVRLVCEGRTTCILTADSTVLGEDPCPSVPKYLQVQYQCVLTLTPRQSVVTTPTTTTAQSTSLRTTPTTPTKIQTTSTSTQTTPTSTQTTPTQTSTATSTSTTVTPRRQTVPTHTLAPLNTNASGIIHSAEPVFTDTGKETII